MDSVSLLFECEGKTIVHERKPDAEKINDQHAVTFPDIGEIAVNALQVYGRTHPDREYGSSTTKTKRKADGSEIQIENQLPSQSSGRLSPENQKCGDRLSIIATRQN